MSVAVPAGLCAASAVVLVAAGRAHATASRADGVASPVASTRVAGRWGGPLVLVALPAAALLGGTTVVLGGAAVVVLGRLERRRRARHRHHRELDACFPDLVDLFRIAAAAGHPVHRCLEVVAARAPRPARPVLAEARARVRRGMPLADALEVAGPRLGPSGPVLTDALRAASRTGSPLVPVLDQVVSVARDRRTRSAQAAARRLPVSMVFPLVCCVLPAFGLLGVVPLLAGSLGSLTP